MVNAWFSERVHTAPPSASRETPPQTQQSSADAAPTSSILQPTTYNLLNSRCPSPAAPSTPTRKISASEFDRPLRPIVVKDSEGSLTFLSDTDRGTASSWGSVMGDGGVGGCSRPGGGSEGDRCTRLLELVKDVSSHLDVTALCHRIFLHINELIAADRYSLFLVGAVGNRAGGGGIILAGPSGDHTQEVVIRTNHLFLISPQPTLRTAKQNVRLRI